MQHGQTAAQHDRCSDMGDVDGASTMCSSAVGVPGYFEPDARAANIRRAVEWQVPEPYGEMVDQAG